MLTIHHCKLSHLVWHAAEWSVMVLRQSDPKPGIVSRNSFLYLPSQQSRPSSPCLGFLCDISLFAQTRTRRFPPIRPATSALFFCENTLWTALLRSLPSSLPWCHIQYRWIVSTLRLRIQIRFDENFQTSTVFLFQKEHSDHSSYAKNSPENKEIRMRGKNYYNWDHAVQWQWGILKYNVIYIIYFIK